MEIDMITKPKDMQKAMYQEKLKLEETKTGIKTRSKRITKSKANNFKTESEESSNVSI
jgi:hypothetical protein